MSLKKLNKVQKAAVEANDGPILIFAGAGSGKTRVLTHKMYFLIDKGLYKPCLLYTSPSPRDATLSRMPSSA